MRIGALNSAGAIMKSVRLLSVGTVLFLAMNFCAQAQDRVSPGESAAPLATGDPLKVLYRISGITDKAGVATSFHCSNFSGVTESMTLVVRNFNGTVLANTSFSMAPSQTKTVSTRGTNLYAEDVTLNTGPVTQGLALIRATSIDIICSAMTVNATAALPQGFDLHMVRSNPMAGTQE
jgi:hypothetical protein